MAPIQKKSTPASRNLPRFSYSPAKLRPLFALVVDETAIVEHKLRVPKKCVKLFGEELSELSTFTVPHGNGSRAWQVRVVKNGKKEKDQTNNKTIWFKDGMKDFMNYYSIHLHSILQFTYQGNSMFSVRICDALGSEIDYPFAVDVDDDDEEEEEEREEEDDDDDEDDDDYVCGSVKRRDFSSQKQPRKSARRSVDSKSKDHNFKHFQTRNVSFIKKEDEDEDDEDEEEEINVTNKKNKSHIKQEVGEDKNEMIVPRSFIYSRGRTVVSKRTKKAVQAAYASKLHNPSFLVVVKRNMEVPAEFVRRHMKFCPERVQLQASNDERNNWAVRCYYVHQDRALVKRLGQGWSSFSSSQGLKKGDVCVFEMIRMVDGAVFRVWISRAAEYA